MIRTVITDKVVNILSKLKYDTVDFAVEYPDEKFGDFAVNAALILGKKLGKNPNEIAEKIAFELEKDSDVISVSIDGPGFINIKIKEIIFIEELDNILSKKFSFDSIKDKKVLFEYTDPNPFKPLHIGHLMTNAIGESLSRMYEKTGAKVFRICYQGDIGPHVAKALWGMQNTGKSSNIEDVGNAYVLGSENYEENKEEIDKINESLYSEKIQNDLKSLYDKSKKISLEHFDKIYKILGTKFDKFLFESQTGPIGKEIVSSNRGVFEDSDGAVIWRGEEKGLHTRVFITSKNTPTYETKELGLYKVKKEDIKYDESVIITANEQKSYFQVVFKVIEEIFGDIKGCKFVFHGLMKFSDGKMSSRKGNVITGEELLKSLTEKAKEKGVREESIAPLLAVASIKYSILKQEIGKDIVFDADKEINLTGDSGPYLLYTLARAKSLISKGKKGKEIFFEPCMVKELCKFEELTLRSIQDMSPHHLVVFSTKICSLFNEWYEKEKIVGSDSEKEKLALVDRFIKILEESLILLGIPTVDKI